jgi:molybdopterin-guanine dinucleotide biosynthesis protein A
MRSVGSRPRAGTPPSADGPAPGRVPPERAAGPRAASRAGELKLRDALAELDAAVIELPAEALANVNSPAELARARGTPVEGLLHF